MTKSMNPSKACFSSAGLRPQKARNSGPLSSSTRVAVIRPATQPAVRHRLGVGVGELLGQTSLEEAAHVADVGGELGDPERVALARAQHDVHALWHPPLDRADEP